MFDTKSNQGFYFKMASDLMQSNNEKLSEISERLKQSHLSYLQTEDTPLKLEQRRKLERYIKEYLCLVQNELKYYFPSTADILHRSAATVQNFSGYKACTAWTAISLYAAHLLAQPWRKEYRTLRTYSGYYKHEVEGSLIGAEVMFELMGYKHTGLGVLTLDGPIDPDMVSSVSRDAIVAFVECQILKEIWEGVSKNFTISWLEVLEFRENNTGTPEQAIRALNFRFEEKLRGCQSKSDLYYSCIPPPVTDILSPSIQHPFSLSNHNTLIPSYQYFGNTGISLENCRRAQPDNLGNQHNTYSQRNAKHLTVPNHTILSTCTPKVPTSCLIELDLPNYEKSYSPKMNHKDALDEVDFSHLQIGNKYQCGKHDRKYNTFLSSAENWDQVYNGHKGIEYLKDFGDQDNILYKKEFSGRTSKYKPSKSIELEEANRIRRDEKKKLGRMQNEQESAKFSRSNHCDHISYRTKSFDAADLNSQVEFIPRKIQERNEIIYQTMPNAKTYQATEPEETIVKSMRDLKISHENDSMNDKWTCSACTFLNTSKESICEMCLKSRHKGNEDVPLASGGKQCLKCTLVNEKDVSRCTACNTKLEDSPTYI